MNEIVFFKILEFEWIYVKNVGDWLIVLKKVLKKYKKKMKLIK